jgi:hypothetical protein
VKFECNLQDVHDVVANNNSFLLKNFGCFLHAYMVCLRLMFTYKTKSENLLKIVVPKIKAFLFFVR